MPACADTFYIGGDGRSFRLCLKEFVRCLPAVPGGGVGEKGRSRRVLPKRCGLALLYSPNPRVWAVGTGALWGAMGNLHVQASKIPQSVAEVGVDAGAGRGRRAASRKQAAASIESFSARNRLPRLLRTSEASGLTRNAWRKQSMASGFCWASRRATPRLPQAGS